jgi:hypothetical protein
MVKGKVTIENGLLVAVEMSNSLIQKFIKKGNEIDYCPKQIYATYMTGEYSFDSTIAMKRGIYFETMLLGKNARDEEVSPEVTASKGLPTAEQKRIDQQIINAKNVFEDRGIKFGINDVQVKGRKQLVMPELDFDIHLTQLADIISPIRYRDEMFEKAVIDIKLTSNLTSTFGDFGWGAFEWMDKNQAYVGSYVHNLPFFYLVFDYPANNMGYRLFKVNTLQSYKGLSHEHPIYNEVLTRYHEMKETTRKTAAFIDYHNSTEWEARPHVSLCVDCPVSHMCDDSYKYEAEY